MAIYEGDLMIEGTLLKSESPLPMLRDQNQHREFEVHSSVPKSLSDTLGHYCGYRVLPYKLQNHYSRDKETVKLKTLVLENDQLKATFLPEYGGRLYSLYSKTLKKELLSVNPVFQPANLGLRNAWFSGGIEWNMAHFGHSYLSCEHVHFGTCINEEGETFLRLYEYERVKKLYYQIDFYLPKNADCLVTYTKIFNTNDEATPLYYWSNTAVSELNNARVFSSTSDVLYIKPYNNTTGEMVNTFSYGKLPLLEGIEGDVTYPRSFDRSNEYFYQTAQNTRYPWEAVGYEDGSLFYECSNEKLKYRKMFCWGKHSGGTKWQEYLSKPAGDKYVEIQAGVFPSQLHSDLLKGQNSVEFMQIFGGLKVDEPKALYKDIDLSSTYVSKNIFKKLENQLLETLEVKMSNQAFLTIDDVLHRGKGWGYLEQKKSEKENKTLTIASMKFDENSLSDEQLLYLDLLEGSIDESYDLSTTTLSYMVDLKWEKYLLNQLNHEAVVLNLGLMYSENDALLKGISLMETYARDDYSSLYYRTLAAMHHKVNHHQEAVVCYKRAFDKLPHMSLDCYKEDFLHEYLTCLYKLGFYEEAWTIYESIGEGLTEELLLDGALLAFELKKYDLVKPVFDLELARIREGDNTLVELWFKMKAVEEHTQDMSYIRQHHTPPKSIDFRMV